MNEENQGSEAIEIMSTSVVEQLTRGEVDMQVTTAKRYPRSIKAFKQTALTLAVSTPEIAAACFYVLPDRGSGPIEGPGIRLAEIVAGAWGNLRCETRVLGSDEKTVTAQATAWDMERNVLIRCETQRRITTRDGKRYNDDMVVVTGNAACSVALRNAIFRVIPFAHIQGIYRECKQLAAKSSGGIDQAKKDWLSHFERMGVNQDQVLELLKKPGLEDMDLEDITTLQGLYTALSEGQTTIEQVFPPALKPGVQNFGFKAKTKKNGNGTPKAKPSPKTLDDPTGGKAMVDTISESIPGPVGPPPQEPEPDPWLKHMPGDAPAEKEPLPEPGTLFDETGIDP